MCNFDLKMKSQIFLLCFTFLAASANDKLVANTISGYIPVNGIDPNDPIKPLREYVQSHKQQFRSLSNITIDGDKLQGCWKHSYGRGVGRPIHACAEDMELDAGLCYPYCRAGYDGVGPVCWEQCQEGYDDTGCCCTRWAEIIGSNNDACPWYDICGLTFEQGCSFCPEHDPPYHNDGCTCRIDVHTYAKDSYGRGVGKPMGCSADEEYDAGLCYDPCAEGYDGVGPVCWQQCPRARPYDAGALCCTNQEACTDFIVDFTKAVIALIAAIIEAGFDGTILEAIQQLLETAGEFVLLSCKRFTIGI